jgi:hypothetical protein
MGHLDTSDSSSLRPVLPQRIVVYTLCATVQEFIECYRGYFTADAWFVTNSALRCVGALATFSFELRDGGVVLRGVGRIAEVWCTAVNPFRCPGAWLEDLEAAPGCEAVLEQLMCASSRAQLADGTDRLQLQASATEQEFAEEQTRPRTLSYGMAPLKRPSQQ